jgi:hypothetical protein
VVTFSLRCEAHFTSMSVVFLSGSGYRIYIRALMDFELEKTIAARPYLSEDRERKSQRSTVQAAAVRLLAATISMASPKTGMTVPFFIEFPCPSVFCGGRSLARP